MKNNKIVKSLLQDLNSYVYSRSMTSLKKGRYLSACIRSSFVKTYEFIDLAFRKLSQEHAFFLVTNLRGITEDLIYLRFMTTLNLNDRDNMIEGLMVLEVFNNISHQNKFFCKFRPFQPVLNNVPSNNLIDKTRLKIQKIWRQNGWPNLQSNYTSPPTRQIAERTDPNYMEIIYDYIFRLTSDTVHFKPGILLRSGWGPSKSMTKFTTSNMSRYYFAFSRIYGIFLFTLYFEFFPRFLKPGDRIQGKVEQLRELILREQRWPEMVTFEEMNQAVPKKNIIQFLIQSIYTLEYKSGFFNK